ncbi:hypothetical protein MPTK1_6g19460 [Marchantia polymorpha subsp. ruderalis]|uniref:Uncharacterized protein n=2 Tax=Marchantia polymorpha TaxID=3197 RepID=A0A176WKH0_MARPO|nr:hypothetical protein AXG93_1467s1420 [Marchantia polymorpha subsp. ruderalis]PTQ39466.1 hypothetical protein MARPO_0045s0117 [Marchantia polymorpha]BBN15422.1 hypothetical protein Mp_6g19460 [Marchantia polymorpha subsp. ruderalis]|eukprot:PTQ39466.1 hypothetical protein MARPO_0045s0117 [Marchantia polymorpha]
MASSHQPKTVSWNTPTLSEDDPMPSTPDAHASEIPSTTGLCAREVTANANSQAAKNIAEVKHTVDELMGSQRMGSKAVDPSKPRRFVSL